jgi:hypothetical protein
MRVGKKLLFMILLVGSSLANAGKLANIYTPGGANDMTLEELKSAKIRMLTHVPIEKEFLNKANKIGIKIMPYIDLEKVVKSSGEPALLRNPFWRAVDADTNGHPEWFCINSDGKIRRPFNSANYHLGFEQSCNNHKSLMAAQIEGVRKLMEKGCGGVFIDNASPRHECFGEKLGVHKHDDPKKSNKQCFENTIRKVYKTIKGFGNDKMCAINAGFATKQKGRCDSIMIESAVYSCVHVSGNKNEMGRQYWRSTVFNWKNFRNDKANLYLLQNDMFRSSFSYLMDPCSNKEAAFFSFVYSKLLGLKSWSASPNRWNGDYANFLARRDILRLLYRISGLGKPISKVFLTDQYAYQAFEKAIIIVNASDKAINITVPVKKLKPPLAELFSGRKLTLVNGNAEVTLPFQSGKIIMSEKAVLENYLTEAYTEAKVISDYCQHELKVKNPEFYNTSILKQIGLIESKLQKQLARLQAGKNVDVNELERLSIEVAALSVDRIMRESAVVITKNPQNIDRNKLFSLLKLENDAPKVEIFRGGPDRKVIKPVIRTAKAAFVPFHYWATTFLNIGEDAYFNLPSGPIVSHGSSGEVFVNWRTRRIATLLIDKLPGMDIPDRYVVPAAFETLEKLSDTNKVKTYSALCKLVGRKSRKKIKNYKLKMIFSVSSGSPFLKLNFSLVDKKLQKIVAPWFRLTFSDTCGYFTSVTGSSVSQKRQQAPWTYFVLNKNDKMGVVALGEPTLNLFKNGFMEKGSLKCAIAPLCAREYYFLKERIRNLKLYTAKSVALLNDIYMNIIVPERFSMKGKNIISLKLENCAKAAIKSVEWNLQGGATGKLAGLVPLKIKQLSSSDTKLRLDYAVEVPTNCKFRENDFAYFIGGATITLANGKQFRVEDFVSRRLKGVFQIGEFNVFKRKGLTEIEASVKVSSLLPCQGKVSLTADDSKVKVRPDSVDFKISRSGEKLLAFQVSAPIEMLNRMTTGTLTVRAEKQPEKAIPVKIKFSPSVDIPFLNGSIVLDGKLNEPVWKKAGFKIDFLNYKSPEKPKDPTRVSVFCTRDALYVGFKCYTRDMRTLVEDAVPDKDGYSGIALKNDSFEIYLRPQPVKNGTFYLRFGANSKGVKRNDEFVDVSLIQAGIYSNTQKNTWHVKTAKYSDRWEAEVKIPFSVIEYKPKKEAVWGINFCRNQPRGDGSTCWSCTYGAFNKTNFFGWGIFK